MGKAWISVLVAGLWCSSAFADGTNINVQTLLSDCTGSQSSFEYTLCVGYVGGVSDQMTLNGLMVINGDDRSRFVKAFSMCPQPHPTWGAEIQAFVNWAQKHPEQWQQPGLLGVLAANRTLWPCS
jgi:hypothetical protein